MTKSLAIPNTIFDTLKKDNYQQIRVLSLAKKLLKDDYIWFEKASEYFGFDVSPKLVYFTSVVNDNHTYTPVYCKHCGKLLTWEKLKAKHICCSMKCTKQLPEMRAMQSAIMKDPIILEKRRQTWLKKYGTEVPARLQEVKNKAKKTCLARYGTEYVYQSKEFKEKRHAICLERYGAAEPFAAPSVKEKVIYTSTRSRRANHFDLFLSVLANKKIEMLSSKEEYIDATKPLKFRCLQCGYTWTRLKDNEDYGLVPQYIYCNPCFQSSKSRKEQEFFEYIKSIYSGKIIRNTRKILKGKELDIYLPEKHLAFEFNGTYWHSTECLVNYKQYPMSFAKKLHQQKSIQCNRLGIRLIHIFEYEWVYNSEKIKALIRSALGIFEKKIYARKCQVKEITSKEYEDFLYLYHLQGPVKSSTRFGLFYQDELIAVIGFGQSRFKKGELELHRYCVKSDYQIIGGFSKLIKHSDFNHFISYIDLSHYSGLGYKKIGFKLISLTAPSYCYATTLGYLSRMQCQKHKLAKLLKKFDPALSESENMAMNNYFKVYDAGNLKVKYSV